MIEIKSIGGFHEGLVTREGAFYLIKSTEDTTKFDWIEELKAPFYLGGPLAEFFGGIVLKAIWKKNLNNLKKIIEQ